MDKILDKTYCITKRTPIRILLLSSHNYDIYGNNLKNINHLLYKYFNKNSECRNIKEKILLRIIYDRNRKISYSKLVNEVNMFLRNLGVEKPLYTQDFILGGRHSIWDILFFILFLIEQTLLIKENIIMFHGSAFTVSNNGKQYTIVFTGPTKIGKSSISYLILTKYNKNTIFLGDEILYIKIDEQVRIINGGCLSKDDVPKSLIKNRDIFSSLFSEHGLVCPDKLSFPKEVSLIINPRIYVPVNESKEYERPYINIEKFHGCLNKLLEGISQFYFHLAIGNGMFPVFLLISKKSLLNLYRLLVVICRKKPLFIVSGELNNILQSLINKDLSINYRYISSNNSST